MEPEIHLSPCFGKRDGFGEPDALILGERAAVIVEVETTRVEDLPGSFFKQLGRFAELAESLDVHGKRRFRGYLQGRGGRRVRGKYRTRKLIDTALKRDLSFYYLVIGEGRKRDGSTLRARITGHRHSKGVNPDSVGWLTFTSISRMRGLTAEARYALRMNRTR
jgi:hypothetical protein